MERWSGRVAVVTGASAGIGAAIAVELARKGMRVAGLARRADRVQELSASLDGAPGQLVAVACDLTKEEDILAAFDWVNGNLGGVDVLVNNAGVLYIEPLISGDPECWRQMLKVNVLALSICTREALKSMNNRKVDGHIIHINSVAGHYPSRVVGGSMYGASKHAVTALTEGLRLELVNSGSKVKVTSVSPGVVHTDMVTKFGNVKGLQPQDLAASVIFTLSTPPHVQIHELMLRAVPEVMPTFEQLDFPLEFQRGSPPERPPEVTRESPPENPPIPEPEKQPEIFIEHPMEPPPEGPPEHPREPPAEGPPDHSIEPPPEGPPEHPREPPPEGPPEHPREPPPEGPPKHAEHPSENQPQHPEEPPPDKPSERPPENPPENREA